MKRPEFKDYIIRVAKDKSLSVDERIDQAFLIRQETMPADGKEQFQTDIDLCQVLVKMIQEENSDHIYDLAYMQLLVLEAEAMVNQENYRDIIHVADDALSLLRDDMTPVEVYEQTMPRLIDAVSDTVYNHALYELLLRYVRAVLPEKPDDKEMKRYVVKLLKLQVLLPYTGWCDHLLDKELQGLISNLLTSREMMGIIMNPTMSHLHKDPVEYTREWEEIYYDVEEELDRRFANARKGMGFCFMFWSAKKELLAQKYGIDWKSPAAMNPGVMFD